MNSKTNRSSLNSEEDYETRVTVYFSYLFDESDIQRSALSRINISRASPHFSTACLTPMHSRRMSFLGAHAIIPEWHFWFRNRCRPFYVERSRFIPSEGALCISCSTSVRNERRMVQFGTKNFRRNDEIKDFRGHRRRCICAYKIAHKNYDKADAELPRNFADQIFFHCSPCCEKKRER